MAIAKAEAEDVMLFIAIKLLPTERGFIYIPNLLSIFYTTAQNFPSLSTPEIPSKAFFLGILT